MHAQIRIARPVSDLNRTRVMYCAGLSLRVIGSFTNHDGFDGVMLGDSGMAYHFEFTRCQAHPVAPCPTADDLVVFYLPDRAAWMRFCANMEGAGFETVSSFNPFWDRDGKTFRDPDGYRLVLQNAAWSNAED